MSVCQHPVSQLRYGPDYALICGACSTGLVPGDLGPDMYLGVACPACGADRFWFCQQGHGRSRGAHRERWAALAAHRQSEVAL